MPHISKRQNVLNALEKMQMMVLAVPFIKVLVPYLDKLIYVLRNTRYLKCRKTKKKKRARMNLQFINDIDSDHANTDLRMSRGTFKYLVSKIEDHPIFKTTNKKQQCDVSFQLEVFLMYLCSAGDSGSYYRISQNYGIGEGTVYSYIRRCSEAVMSLQTQAIWWPGPTERELIRQDIEKEIGIKGAVGIIDGTTFRLLWKPQLDAETYFSWKSIYCISAQVVCDANRLVRAFHVGFPGSVHDSRQFQSMKIWKNRNKYFSAGEFLLGDAAYAASHVMVHPYKKPANALPENAFFNMKLSSVRIRIEHCIGMIKAQFG